MKNEEKWYADLLADIIELRFTEPQRVLENAKKLYTESMIRKDFYHAAIAKFYEGDAYLSLDELGKASEPIFESIQIQKTHGCTEYLGKASNLLGCIFYSQGDMDLSMKYFLGALEEAIQIKDYVTQTYIYNNIAAVFIFYEDYKNAHLYFEKSWNSHNNCEQASRQNQFSMTRLHLNLGICLDMEGKYEEARRILEEIIAEVTEEEYECISMLVWEFAASLYTHLGEKEKACGFALQMAENIRQKCNVENINITFVCIRILIENGYMREARNILEQIDVIAQKSESTLNEAMVLQEWIHFYQEIQDEEACNRCYQKYYELKNLNKENSREKQILALENRKLMTELLLEKKTLLQEQNKYEQLSTKDFLTGLLNRNGMRQIADKLWENQKKKQSRICLAIIDIDHFKEYNDRYGHLTGDQCLQELGKVIQSMEKENIWGVRYGGDEFFLLGDGFTLREWNEILVDLQRKARAVQVISKTDVSKAVSFTVSIGSFCKVPDSNMHFHEFIHYADCALYKMKQGKRDDFLIVTETD